MLKLVALALSSLSLVACTTYRQELTRAQHAYDANDHDQALALARAIEPNVTYLTQDEQIRYYYLRGMTDYRIGYRGEARHYLAVARAMATEAPGALPDDSKNRMEEALTTLNTEVYANGIQSIMATDADAANNASAKKAKKKN